MRTKQISWQFVFLAFHLFPKIVRNTLTSLLYLQKVLYSWSGIIIKCSKFYRIIGYLSNDRNRYKRMSKRFGSRLLILRINCLEGIMRTQTTVCSLCMRIIKWLCSFQNILPLDSGWGFCNGIAYLYFLLYRTM